MSKITSHDRTHDRTTAARLARTHRAAALEVGDAVLIGNLAGVVEWTHEAWTRLTGFPLSETLDKPITHFLDRAGLEVELVEFVAQRFLAGQPCTVEMPFETFDGRSIHVHLEVEPLRDEYAEISRFIAVARQIEAPEQRASAPCPSAISSERAESATERAEPAPLRDASPIATRPVRAEALLAEALARSAERAQGRGLEVALEALLPPALPRARVDADALERLLDRLLDAALCEAETWPVFVTGLAGSLTPGRSHLSKVHPIPQRSCARYTSPHVYLEIHDSGPHLDPAALARIRRCEPARSERERALIDATRDTRALGLPFWLDSTPGCGTQALVLLPPSRD